MRKWKLKGCPRCKGDLLIEVIDKGWAEYCLQCSYRKALKVVAGTSSVGASPAEVNVLTPVED